MAKNKISSAIILTRKRKQGLEVYLVKRSPKLRFFGGYWAFPGGNIDPIDYHHEHEALDIALKRCAIRELLEELNLLSTTLGRQISDSEKEAYKGLLKGEPQQWQDLIRGVEGNIEAVCTFITPAFAPVRYETQFMHIDVPDYETPVIDNQELVDGRFLPPQEAVDAWENGDMEIAPPVLLLLRLLAAHDINTFRIKAQRIAQSFANGALHSVFFSPGIFTAPLPTPTLPPATTTNTFIVGHEKLYIIDPATPEPSEQQRLFNKMDELIAAGKTFQSILLTHHHADHVGAVAATSRGYQLPVRAHSLCYERLSGDFICGEPIQDGDILDLGTSPNGKTDWHMQVLHTPGHAVDHVCFIENCYHALIAGDMLSTVSTIVIDPPEGHMHTYLDSLKKILTHPIKTLHPAHGPSHRDGRTLIKQYLKHRQDREEAIIAALSTTPRPLDALLPIAYADVPTPARSVAKRSLLAGLIKLKEDGVCQQTGQGWQLSVGT